MSSPASPTPVEVVPRAHHALLRRSAAAVQLGVLPGRAIEVAGLPLAAADLLVGLDGVWRVTDLVAALVTAGLDEFDGQDLVDSLIRAGALCDARATTHRVQRRHTSSVLVGGVGALAGEVAVGLARAGVGSLWLDPTAAEPAHRVRAAGATVRSGRPTRPPELAVFCDEPRIAPARHRALRAAGVSQLVARVTDGVGLVGPLVLPGRSACLDCLELRRAEHDPNWPFVRSFLGDRVGGGSPATLAATAALAVEQALLALDPPGGDPPPTLDAVWELDLTRAALRSRRWPAHPTCDCGAAHNRSPIRAGRR